MLKSRLSTIKSKGEIVLGPKFYTQLACVVVIGAFFLFQFIKTKKVAQLLIAIWAPITLLSYVSSDKTYTYILGGVEFLLFIAVIFFLFKGSRKNHIKNMLNDSLPGDENDVSANSDDKKDEDQ